MKLKSVLVLPVFCGATFLCSGPTVQAFPPATATTSQPPAAKPAEKTVTTPQVDDDHRLWDSTQTLPNREDLKKLKNVTFIKIKAFEPEVDGYRFLHGVALCWHKGKLYASWGNNKGSENTGTEEARGRVSEDGGKTWGEVFTIDDGGEDPTQAVSHGVFLSHDGQLWAFHGAFTNSRKQVHAKAYVLDESTGQWQRKGVVARDGFWPLQEPVKMDDGNWIMAGASLPDKIINKKVPGAVAISHGDDLTKWDVVVLNNQIDPELSIWGESTVLVNGKHITNICRFGGKAQALVAQSHDYGRTWTDQELSNLPMATSKPYSGTLSTGENYLVCTNTANSRGRRAPLTIALSRPGEPFFSRVYFIRDSVMPGDDINVDSAVNAALSYPYAVEHDGKLYVGYSNNAARKGTNINSAELAIIPLKELQDN